MPLVTLVLFLIGVALLIVGAELLVRGAARLAGAVGVSPLVIGLTVVALGTSAPELAVTVRSSLTGTADIGFGNIIGSNICNTLLILGVAALVAPLVVSQQLVRMDVPIMIGASALLFAMVLDGVLNRMDGVILFTGLVVYTVVLLRQSRRETAAERARTNEPEPVRPPITSLLGHLGFVLFGLSLLILGSRWLVDGAVMIAEAFGVSQLVIGLTVVAVGTSMPEVATSVLAGLRGERDIAVGNVIGSNLYNILAVLGIAGVISPAGIPVAPAAINFDLPIMLAAAAACLPIFFSGRINRWEGGLFFGYYIAYTLFLILRAAQHDALPEFSMLMGSFVLPLTGITLIALLVREIRRRRSGRQPG
jgi:cation:H+ antiporter